MDAAAWIGPLAGVLSTASFVPQAWHILRRRRADDVSWGTYLLLTAGVGLWMAYGWLRDDRPLLWTNGLIGVNAVAILLMKWRYQRRTARR